MLNTTSFKSNNSSKEDTLRNTGKTIEEAINRDQEYHDLADALNGSNVESYIQPLLKPEEVLKNTNKVNLPNEIIEYLAGMECRCFMGLLPEINRAWITIDNRLIIWNLDNEKDNLEYCDQDQVIITAAIIKPAPNIFGDHIKYLIALSTPLQVILLALSIDQKGHTQAMQLYATGMTVSADDVQILHIQGTDDGRIFMIGNNGGLFELEYTHPNKWFKQNQVICRTEPKLAKFIPTFTPGFLRPANPPHVKSIAIDNERKMLYILYIDSSIELVYLGDPVYRYKSICRQTNIIDDAIHKFRQQSKFFNTQELEISSIHVISEAESKKIHLLAITIAGYRLYFSHYKDAFRPINQSAPINKLELGYIRGPPQDMNRDPHRPPRFFTNIYYKDGICLSIHPQSDVMDQIEMTSATFAKPATESQANTSSMSYMMNSNKSAYTETALSFNVHDKISSIVEINQDRKLNIKEIAQQFSDPPRQFMMMANLCVYFFKKLRPVDTLYDILLKTRGLEKDAALSQSFFDRYGKTESCAMCLSVICSVDDDTIKTRGKNLFFDYGGSPSASFASQVTGNHLGRIVGPTGIHYSGKHDGFILYFARIVSPVWKLKMFANRGNDINAYLYYNESQRTLYNTKMNLLRLKQFMDENPQFHDSANISNPRFQTTDHNTVQLELTEQKSVHDVYLLLAQCIEAIAFIEFILDSNIQMIIANYLNNNSDKIYNLDLSSILTSEEGKELTRDIVIATIARYTASNSHAEFDIVSRQLEKFCHSFYNESDLHFFKGVEYIRRAFMSESENERDNSLKESLKHFKLAAKDISDQKINSVCGTYKTCSFHVGIVELGLERAEQIDPQEQAMIAYETSANYRDENSQRLLNSRLNTYSLIFDALNDVFEVKRSGKLPEHRAPISDLNMYYKTLINTAVHSKDRLFHFELYKWLMEKNAMDELLSVDTEYLIPYLEKYVTNKRASLEFLWKYYRIKEKFVEAASCLEKLAELPFEESALKIEDRVNYLAQAVINGRCETVINPNLSFYIGDLEKKLQWAQLQARIKGILSSSEGLEAKQATFVLDQCLFTRSELEKEFISKFSSLTQFLK